MKKLVLLTAVVLATISLTFAQTEKIDVTQAIPIHLRASVQSIPSCLNKYYTNGDVIFEYFDSYSKGYKEFTKPYTGLGNYDVYFGVSWVPETVYLTVKLDINTRYYSRGPWQTYVYTGKAAAMKVFENYMSVFNCDINETDFYEIVEYGPYY